MDSVWKKYGKEGMADIARKYQLDLTNPEHQFLAAQEKIAEISESGTDASTWQKFVAVVTKALRGMGIDINLTEAEIRVALMRSRQLVADERAKQIKVEGLRKQARNIQATWVGPDTNVCIGEPEYLYHASRRGDLYKIGIKPSVAGVIRKDPQGAKVFMSSDPQDAINSLITEERLKAEHGQPNTSKGSIIVYKIKFPQGTIRDARSGDYVTKESID